MSFRRNDGLRNALGDAFGDIFNGGTLQIRSGAQPADPDDAASGTLIAEIELPADAFNAAAGGVISFLGVWSAVAIATATAGWGRFISSDTLKTFDISVGEAATDLILDEEDVVTGNVINVTAFTITFPAS